jgi:hypothetical protein
MTFVPDIQLEERAEVVAAAVRHVVGKVTGMSYPVSVHPSPVTMSPFMHVYIFLTPKHFDGKYIQISHQEEMDEGKGYIFGVYDNYEDETTPKVVASLQDLKREVAIAFGQEPDDDTMKEW